MIFKRWFKPKWQHENAAIRQLAIADLDHQTPQQKEILHELAFNDGAETVRRAALERLNEFSLWWQASKHESAERLKLFAEQQLINMLLENRVSAHLKMQFIAECNRMSVLEKLAVAETEPQIKFDLLVRLNRADLIVQALHDSVLDSAQKQQLLSSIQDERQLEKLQKSLYPELAEQAAQQITAIRETKLKPERIRKQVVLFLAKMNAIREKTDAIEAEQTFAEAQQQWGLVAEELMLLPDAAEFSQKYEKICQLTTQSLAPKLAEAQQQRIEQERVLRSEKNFQQFSQQMTLVSQQLATLLGDGALDAAAEQQTAIDALLNQIQHAELQPQQLRTLEQQAKLMQQRLDKLPVLAEGLSEIARLIAELSAQPLPDASNASHAYQGFLAWQKSFQRKSKAIAEFMPSQFSQSYELLVQQWRQHCEPLLAEQQKALRQLKGKFAEFKRLHDAGKYNVLFGLHKGINQQFDSLDAQQQQLVSAEKQAVDEIIQKLADLQSYIATPRKQQLLQDVLSLIDDQSLTMSERAGQIKQMRATWNSLGKAEQSLDAELNEQFNTACEQAFAPCREYFAEQDALRAASAVKKAEIISQLAAFVESQLTGKALDAALQQIQKEWEQSGVAEKSVYAQLQPQYQTLLSQLKNRQVNELKNNAQAKQALVAKASALVAEASAENLVQAVKELQSQWTAIGFAGRKVDQQLWAEFRHHCDAIFARRTEIRQQQLQESKLRREQLSAQLQTLVSAAATADTESSITQTLAELSAFSAQDDVRNDRQLQQQSRDLRTVLLEKSSQTERAQSKRDVEQLFVALANPDVDTQHLPPLYRLVFNQQQEQLLSRADLTLALEWAAGASSPDAEQARRQQVQMLLLTDKHNSGNSCSQDELLGRWLQYGPFTVSELSLLERVKRLYCAD